MCNGVCNWVGHNVARVGTVWHDREGQAAGGHMERPGRGGQLAGLGEDGPGRHVRGGRATRAAQSRPSAGGESARLDGALGRVSVGEWLPRSPEPQLVLPIYPQDEPDEGVTQSLQMHCLVTVMSASA